MVAIGPNIAIHRLTKIDHFTVGGIRQIEIERGAEESFGIVGEQRLGTRQTIAIGLAATALGLVPMLLLGVEDQYWLLWPSFLLIGFSLEVALVAANDVIISSVPADEAGGVSAIEETSYELGSGFGVAVLGSILAAAYSASVKPIEGVSSVGLENARESLSRAVEISEGMPTSMAEQLLTGSRAAFMSGYHTMILVSIALIGVTAVVSALVLGGQEHRQMPPDTAGE